MAPRSIRTRTLSRSTVTCLAITARISSRRMASRSDWPRAARSWAKRIWQPIARNGGRTPAPEQVEHAHAALRPNSLSSKPLRSVGMVIGRASPQSRRAACRLFTANAVGDDVELYTDAKRAKVLERFHFLRQQSNKEGSEPCRSLADFIAPKETGLRDHIGAFAVTSGIGLKELCESYRAKHDDYNAIMAEAIADRLAEAFAECLHKRVRDEWGYGCAEGLSNADLIQEKYRGIRPAAGYPACPDHTEKGSLWRLLDAQANTGMLITESFAMWPGSSVSGLYFAHPESRYFSLGKIDRDQVADYSERKGMSVSEVERWLGPNLNYDPAE